MMARRGAIAKGVLQRLSMACNSVAVVLLFAAVGLGVWSRLTLPYQRIGQTKGWGIDLPPERLATIAITIGLVLGVLVVAAARRRRAAGVIAAAMAALLVVAGTAALANLPEYYRGNSTYYPPLDRLIPALWACGLAAAGSLAALLGSGTLRRRRSPRTILAGVFIGLVISALAAQQVIASTAMRIDATTAADTVWPPVPASLGGLRFSLPTDLKLTSGSLNAPNTVVLAGGPGFLVREARGIRAYDDAGRERWHYLDGKRPYVYAVSAWTYDDARTVVVKFAIPYGVTTAARLVALDTTTGRRLWASFDPDLVDGYNAVELASSGNVPRYLILRGDTAWTRIDTRTGKRMWTTDVADAIQHTAVDTVGATSYFTGRVSDGRVQIEFVALDPASGKPLYRRRVREYPYLPTPQVTFGFDVAVTQAGGRGVVFTDMTHGTAGASDPDSAWYLDTTSGETAPVNDLVQNGGDGRDAFIGWPPNPGGPFPDLAVYGPGGRRRCGLDAMTVNQAAGIGWLGDQVVVAHHGDSFSYTLHAFDRTDCSAASTAEVPRGYVYWLVPAAGVLLAVHPDHDALMQIDGYATP